VNRLLLPGLYAQATITLDTRADAISLPLQALDQAGGRSTVAVVDASGRIQIRKVVVGIQTDTDAEIISGVDGGETVVVSDRSGLKQGEAVHTKFIDLVPFQGQEDQKSN
jgi:multidrug efflux pump subunit AcrA (membrane-fusion protein)